MNWVMPAVFSIHRTGARMRIGLRRIPTYDSSGFHGEWELAQAGLSGLQLTNGSWIGFSVAAGEYEFDLSAPYNAHKHAPAPPDASITALVKNLTGGFQNGQWQAQFLSCSNWLYSLERSTDLHNWTTVTAGISGNGTNCYPGSQPANGQGILSHSRGSRP